MKTTIIFITAMYSVLTGLIIAVQYQLFRNREKSRERDLNTQVSELTAGIDQRNEEIQRLSSSVIDQDAKIQRLIHERSDAIQAAGFAKAEIESANIRIAVLSERENMLQSELSAFADLLDRYRSQAVSNIELVERVLGVGQVQGERGIEPETETELRKIASLKENECIEIPNDTIRDLVLEQAEREGLKWVSGKNAKDGKYSTPHFLCCKSIGFIENTLVIDRFNVPENILPASKFVEVPQEKEPETDWSKVPFPKGYVIPKNTKVIALKNDSGAIYIGSKGITIETDSTPECVFEDQRQCSMYATELAPLNPTDHPNHPEFKK
jgi:hypothetical protein